jgi:acetate kinase
MVCKGFSMNIWVVNCGSSSLKFQLIGKNAGPDAEQVLAQGVIERIGGQALLTFHAKGTKTKRTAPLRDVRQALNAALDWLVSGEASHQDFQNLGDIHAVGHRVVHGGEKFKASARIDRDVVASIEDCIDLAPLHNPANLNGIRAVTEIFGAALPQVAVFDTSFHLTMSEAVAMYAIPYSLYRRHRIRRYGFHGTSYRFVSQRYRELTGKSPADTHLIVFHLGNGCSACVIRSGQSVDTSMGMTPVEGLMMGTRSGDIDPALLEFIAFKEGMNLHELIGLLNRQSGLLGISGLTNDMRDLLEEYAEHGDRRAGLAIDMFCYRARKYLGAYLVAAGGVDAIVFCGGIGENAAVIRERILAGLERFGLSLDAPRNQDMVGGREGCISQEGSSLSAWVIPTNEEIMIARDTFELVQPED